MESRDWRLLFDIHVSSHSTGVPYVRAAVPTIDIICSNSEENPLRLPFVQNVNDDVGGVIWDCGLLLVDYVLVLAAEHETIHSVSDSNVIRSSIKSDSSLSCVLDLGTGTGVAGIVAAINGAQRCILTDYKAYPVMLENLSNHHEHIHRVPPEGTDTDIKVCSFLEYSW